MAIKHIEPQFFNCPACGRTDTVPRSSLIRQPRPVKPNEILIQGTCDCCGSTRTQWVEDESGNYIRGEQSA